MRPVNLLPQKYRPHRPSGRGGSAYVVVGVLAALVLASLLYVVTSNQISSRKDDITKAKNETAEAKQRSAQLAGYGDFHKIAATRTQSITQIANGRLDYERLMRETASVLPTGVWLTGFDAETQPDSSSSSSSSTSANAPTGPSVKLTGCAPNQDAVATTLVRLRQVHGSGEVTLNDSGHPAPGGASSTTSSSSSSSSTSASGQDCGNHYSFDIDVSLPAATGLAQVGKVPARLGGGS